MEGPRSLLVALRRDRSLMAEQDAQVVRRQATQSVVGEVPDG
jgi:hypothetical protein